MIFCAWDGEEPGLLGSTEWAEQHADELLQHAVAYVNTDGSSRGFLTISGSHALETLGVAAKAALMVGDTTVDLRMGRAAGVDTCAVTYGAHSEEDLRREGPTHLVRRPADLPEVLR